MERIVIVVKGGMVQDVYCSNNLVEVEVMDEDTEDCPEWKDVDVPKYNVW